MTNEAPPTQATPEQTAVIPTQVGMRMVHQSDVQLRVDAMSLAVTVHDKTRWGGDKDTTSEQYDKQLVASARAIHAFLAGR